MRLIALEIGLAVVLDIVDTAVVAGVVEAAVS